VLTEFDAVDPPNETTVTHSTMTRSVREDLPSVSMLSEFLARPVNIGSFAWSGTIGTTNTLSPAQQITTITAIADKLRYFQNIRFTLVVRLQTSTSAHHYGLAGVYIMPAPASDYLLNYVQASSTDFFTLYDANSCDALVMRYPFFYHDDALVLSNGTMSESYCTLFFSQLQPILRDDGVAAGTPIVNVFAWLEDVELMDPTPYTTSSGKAAKRTPAKGSHEGGPAPSGAVSGPMSALSRALGSAAAVPAFAPYAVAASAAAGAVGDLAKLFGYSRPVAPMEFPYMISRPLGNLAMSVGADQSQKLTLDPENQLALSLNQFGAEDDPLAYSSLVRRWGFIGYMSWTTTNALDTVLGVLSVAPIYGPVYSSGIQLPPVSLPTLFNRGWSGSLEYRFVISATPFHRGKLLIWYSPGNTVSTLTTVNVMPAAQNCVLDVANSTEKHIVVKWAQPTTYLELSGSDQTPLAYLANFSTGTSTPTNGTLHIQVLEPLIATAAAATLTISVFMRGGDDMWFGIPYTCTMTHYTTASGPAAARDPFSNLGVTKVKDPACVFGGSTLKSTARLNTVGENIPSLRPLLKRYTPTFSMTSTATSFSFGELGWLHIPFAMYPRSRANTTEENWYNQGSNTGFGATPQSPWGLIAACFLGVRGGIRHKVIDVGALSSPHLYQYPYPKVLTSATLLHQYDDDILPLMYYASAANVPSYSVPPINMTFFDTVSGGDIQINSDGILAQIEVPSSINRNWATPRSCSNASTSGPNGFCLNIFRNNFNFLTQIVVLSAAAEDTNFVFWNGVPPLYLTNNYLSPANVLSLMT
jgi:hypothetical protein